MSVISPAVHRILDFVAVIVFALAPTLFHLHGNTLILAYALAVVHLAVTLATHYPGRATGALSFPMHGHIEVVVGILLIVVPILRHWTYGARAFFPPAGVVLILVWALTRYRPADIPVATTTPPPPAV